MPARFLFRDAIWAELATRTAGAKRVQAAVAYLGTGGAKLLPLREGDQLVVDMSLGTVRSGSTDPHEIRTLLGRGVEVYSRASLHAKFFIFDDVVIVGSSNISKNAREYLDEAAILSTDSAVLARARETFQQICTEPVRKNYLAKCLEEYRRPRFTGGHHGRKKRQPQFRQGKVWLIAGLSYRDFKKKEEEALAKASAKVEQYRHDYEKTELEPLRYPASEKFFTSLRRGDWAICCFREGQGVDVWPPERYLGHETYPWGKGKRRHALVFEVLKDVEPIRWKTFRAIAKGVASSLDRGRPRTMPIENDAIADGLLRLWDAKGRFKARKSR